MLKVLLARMQQKHRTIAYPKGDPKLPDRFVGRPVLQPERCKQGCAACAEACPTNAVAVESSLVDLDLGRCVFCAACAQACPTQAIAFSRDHGMATRTRQDLGLGQKELKRAHALEGRIRRLLGRSLKLRHVSAGGCNACEADLNVLSTVVFDIGRFGIQFVASPRHADGLVVTGPVTQNMRLALMKTYEAVAAPKLVIAAGTCAISGGIYENHPETNNGIGDLLPVDLFIPGCPPHPFTLLDGFLRLLGRI